MEKHYYSSTTQQYKTQIIPETENETAVLYAIAKSSTSSKDKVKFVRKEDEIDFVGHTTTKRLLRLASGEHKMLSNKQIMPTSTVEQNCFCRTTA